MTCLGAETGGQAYDCSSEVCPLLVCQPWRGKLLPKGQRPTSGYDETAEAARLADHLKRHPRKQPSGALCQAMFRECMGVRSVPGMPEEQKGGGNLVSCEKPDCALWSYQPYKPGGPQKQKRSVKQLEAASKGIAALRSARLTEGQNREIHAPEHTRQASATGAQVSMAL